MKMPNSTRRRQQHGIISISVEKSLLGATSALIQFMTLIVPREAQIHMVWTIYSEQRLAGQRSRSSSPQEGHIQSEWTEVEALFRRRVQKQQSISHP